MKKHKRKLIFLAVFAAIGFPLLATTTSGGWKDGSWDKNTITATIGDSLDSLRTVGLVETTNDDSIPYPIHIQLQAPLASAETGDTLDWDLADQSINKTYIDTTSASIPFNDAYRITTAESDSLLSTVYSVSKIAGDTAGVLRGNISDSLWAHLDDSIGVVRGNIGDTAGVLRGNINDSLWTHLDDSISTVRGNIGDTADVIRGNIPDTITAAVARSISGEWLFTDGLIVSGGDTLVIRDGTGADSALIYDTGDSTIFESDNPMRLGTSSVIIPPTGPVIISSATVAGGGDFEDTLAVDTVLLATKIRLVESAAGTVAFEHLDNTAPQLAVGKTTQTSGSGVHITDGGTDKPGYLDLFNESGTGYYFWVDANGILHAHNSNYGADPEGTGSKLIDADNGNTYSTDLHTIYTNTTDSLTPDLVIEQDGTGDAYVSLLLTGGQYYNIRLDNSDNDNLKVALNDGGEAQNDTTVLQIHAEAGSKGVIDAPLQTDARLYVAGATTVDTSDVTYHKVNFDRTSYFTNCTPDTTANYRITVPEAGKYQVNARVGIDANGDDVIFGIALYYNGAVYAKGDFVQLRTDYIAGNVSDVIEMAASGYVEVFVLTYHTAETTANYSLLTGASETYVSLVKVK